tara:strand:- start:398 stop:1174 length:777 start_codon:yes stop_codon:yes gene_type:complete
MENYEALLATLALAMGTSWASGINLYAALLVLGVGGLTGNIDLPAELDVLADPMVIGAAGIMYFIEFFVDKTPGVDTGWDTLHTFIRIPAGAMLAAGTVGDVTPALEIAAGILGGSIAATSHATKSGVRLLINTSPEPLTNWIASISEDILVIAGLWAALNYPVIFLILFAVFICVAIWLLPRMWRLIKVVLQKIGRFLGMITSKPDTVGGFEKSEVGIQEQSSLSALERLQQLRTNGALTEEEFLDQKHQILSKNIK